MTYERVSGANSRKVATQKKRQSGRVDNLVKKIKLIVSP